MKKQVRIHGLVRLLNRVRQRLQAGVAAADLAELEHQISAAIQQTEAICREAGVRPQSLPGPSRNAYRYLKGLDLSRVPLAAAAAPRADAPRVRNLVAAARTCHRHIWELAQGQLGPGGLPGLGAQVDRHVATVEAICARAGSRPARLAKPSRKAYEWLKLLSQNEHLEAHVDTVRRVADLARSRAPAGSRLFVEMTNGANLWECERQGGAIRIRVNEVFLYADDEVLAAVVDAALIGRSGDGRRVIDAFQTTEAASGVLAELDLAGDGASASEAGAVHHLGEVFDRVNDTYFGSSMARPRLVWSESVTYRSFGHYVFATDTLLLSVSLDRPRVPELVVDFVMYHELLHKKHGVKLRNNRRMTHTPAFRRDEAAFERRDEAEALLKTYSRKLGSRR